MGNIIRPEILQECTKEQLYDDEFLSTANHRQEPKLPIAAERKLKALVQDGTVTLAQKRLFMRWAYL